MSTSEKWRWEWELHPYDPHDPGGAGPEPTGNLNIVEAESRNVLATVWQAGNETENTADLIASAPDLLAALESAVEQYGKPGGPWSVPDDPGGWLALARAALKKARGET